MGLSRSFFLLLFTNRIICTAQTITHGNDFHHFIVIIIIIIKIIRPVIFLSAEENIPYMWKKNATFIEILSYPSSLIRLLALSFIGIVL